jgi:hypothetical protein
VRRWSFTGDKVDVDAQHHRQQAQGFRHRGQQYRPEALCTGAQDRFLRRFVVPFRRSKVTINTMLLLTPMPPIKGYYIGVIYIDPVYQSYI